MAERFIKRVRNWLMCRAVNFVSDETFVKWMFKRDMGYDLDLSNPVTFNEKLQWLKLYDKHPEYSLLVDKIEVKKFVAGIIGERYLIPTIEIWNNIEDIDWNILPKQFVIKSSSDSGGVIVCTDKDKLDLNNAVAFLKKSIRRSYCKYNKEYPYKNVPQRFIAEQYLEDGSGAGLIDYKFFCFDGTPKFLFVATGRQQNDTRFDFYDVDFNHLPVTNGHPNADIRPKKPDNYSEMLEVAAKLSQGIPHIRVDLYNVDGRVYFGELTFFHWSGTVPFVPDEWDKIFGDYLQLPIDKC